jgi:phage-related protein
MWTVIVDEPAVPEIRSLPEDLKARLLQIIDMIVTDGPHDLPPNLVRHIEGKLWELRLKARSGIARALYFTVDPRSVVILSAFVKKTQKLPSRELERAKSRMRSRQEAWAANKKGQKK